MEDRGGKDGFSRDGRRSGGRDFRRGDRAEREQGREGGRFEHRDARRDDRFSDRNGDRPRDRYNDRGDRRDERRDGERRFNDRPRGDRFERRDGERRFDRDRNDRGGFRKEGDRPDFRREEGREGSRFGGERREGRFNDRPRGERFERRDGERRFDRDRNERGGFRREDRPDFRRDGERREFKPEFKKEESHVQEEVRLSQNPEQAAERQERRNFDRAPRREGGRPFRKEGSFFRDRELGSIMALDEDLLHMVMRRARMLARLRTAGRIDPNVEKTLRTAWEEKAARIGRDSRLARDLFQLVQSVEPMSRTEDEQSYFNLAPQLKPVDINLAAPADGMKARMVLALAAASGQVTAVRGLALNDGLIDGIKALNQIGGQLWWEEDGSVLSRGGKGLNRNLDRVVHVGDDAFNLWLTIALCLGMPAHLKITGGEALRFADLSALCRFLPTLGARLTNVIPAQTGLPVRLECSGMLPSEVTVPEDFPPRLVAALVLALPFWESKVSLYLALPAEHNAPACVQQALELLDQCGALVRVERRGDTMVITPTGAECHLPEEADLYADALAAAYILAFPAFADGEARLSGCWPSTPFARQAQELLKECGLSVECGDKSLYSKREASAAPAPATLLNIAKRFPDLLPLGVALAALAARGGKEALLPMAELETLCPDSEALCSGFLLRAGFTTDNSNGETRITALPDDAEQPRASWISPSAPWAMALALLAYLKPHIHLANPGVMTELLPSFWNFYNSLPTPDFKRKAAPEVEDVKPARRRIIAQGVYGELPPEVPSDDDF